MPPTAPLSLYNGITPVVVCHSEHWQQAYSFTSDSFASEYDIYLKGFVPGDEPTETKLAAKLAKDSNYIPTSWADK